jgi:cephalosporin-C deacetylase-like acetyl esterase
MLTAALLCVLSVQTTAPAPAMPALEYEAGKPLDIQPAPPANGGVRVADITYAQLDGTRNAATLVTPAGGGPHPAILFVHWYEPPKPTSNRTEFFADAVALAERGVVSLLIDTPWREDHWFEKRDAAKDYEFTVQQSKEVRRALDVLLQQPSIDRQHVALVGHDFGAMFGAMAAAADSRVTHFVYMAGAPTFSEWWLFAPKREGAEREAFVKRLDAWKPITALAHMGTRPVLLQFGTKDRFVSNDAAKAQADAVTGPKTVKLYEGAEHELTSQATRDRLDWLRVQLGVFERPDD